MLLNTSFNNGAEPIVDSIEDAIACFLTTDIDYLILDDFVVAKRKDVIWPSVVFDLSCSLLNYKLVLREAHHKFWVESVPGPIFSAARYPITRELWSCLSNVLDGDRIGCTMDRFGLEKADRVANEFVALWKRRVLKLAPKSADDINIV
jgi:carbamoyltransferase